MNESEKRKRKGKQEAEERGTYDIEGAKGKPGESAGKRKITVAGSRSTEAVKPTRA
jgi:hypothetical protein